MKINPQQTIDNKKNEKKNHKDPSILGIIEEEPDRRDKFFLKKNKVKLISEKVCGNLEG